MCGSLFIDVQGLVCVIVGISKIEFFIFFFGTERVKNENSVQVRRLSHTELCTPCCYCIGREVNIYS